MLASLFILLAIVALNQAQPCTDNATCNSLNTTLFCVTGGCTTIPCGACGHFPQAPDTYCVISGCDKDKQLCIYVTCSQLEQQCDEETRTCVEIVEPSPPTGSGNGDNTLGIALLVFVGLVLVIGACLWCLLGVLDARKKQRERRHTGRGESDMNTRERITLEIPASRKALSDWYNAEHNKRFIYWLSLTVWVVLFLFMFTILPLTATSNYRVTFYLPLVIFMPLLFLTTHWLIQCALSDRVVQRAEETTTYVVAADDEGIII